MSADARPLVPAEKSYPFWGWMPWHRGEWACYATYRLPDGWAVETYRETERAMQAILIDPEDNTDREWSFRLRPDDTRATVDRRAVVRGLQTLSMYRLRLTPPPSPPPPADGPSASGVCCTHS